MRRPLTLLVYLAILALPGMLGSPSAGADSPFSQRGPSTETLSPASSRRHTDFQYRFVTYLTDDQLLALFNAEERREDDDSDVKLMLIEGGDEQSSSAATEDLRGESDDDVSSRTADRVSEAIESASSAVASEDGLPADEVRDDEARDDGPRLAMRLAELNKPAALLTVSMPPGQVGDAPVNQAAEIFDQAPFWIRGHQAMAPIARRVHVAFYHYPTYYQELNLERCGKLDCERCGYLQNLYSSVWFIGNTSLLPYRLASQPPCECVTSYGDCPTCRQYDCPLEPLSLGARCAPTSRGLLSQSAALAGFVLLLW